MLFISPLACTWLSAIFFIVGTIGLVLHAFHLRIRRKAGLYLTTNPGNIATSIALTSYSGFGQLLYPHDSRDTMLEKLEGFRFSLDKRTGAIIANEKDIDLESGSLPPQYKRFLLKKERQKMLEERYSMRSRMMSISSSSLVEGTSPRIASPRTPQSPPSA